MVQRRTTALGLQWAHLDGRSRLEVLVIVRGDELHELGLLLLLLLLLLGVAAASCGHHGGLGRELAQAHGLAQQTRERVRGGHVHVQVHHLCCKHTTHSEPTLSSYLRPSDSSIRKCTTRHSTHISLASGGFSLLWRASRGACMHQLAPTTGDSCAALASWSQPSFRRLQVHHRTFGPATPKAIDSMCAIVTCTVDRRSLDLPHAYKEEELVTFWVARLPDRHRNQSFSLSGGFTQRTTTEWRD